MFTTLHLHLAVQLLLGLSSLLHWDKLFMGEDKFFRKGVSVNWLSDGPLIPRHWRLLQLTRASELVSENDYHTVREMTLEAENITAPKKRFWSKVLVIITKQVMHSLIAHKRLAKERKSTHMRFSVQYKYHYYYIVSLLWIKIWTRRDDRNGRSITPHSSRTTV